MSLSKVFCRQYDIFVNFFQECNIEEVSDEDEAPPKSSKDKKANGPDSGKGPSLIFKITSKVPYKTVLKGAVFSN